MNKIEGLTPMILVMNGALSCQLIKEHAMFVQGTVNDLAAVFNIKCADG